MSLLRTWLARITNRIEVVRDRAAVAMTGHCRHRTHQEMLTARSYCPDCRHRYANWAINVGLEVDPHSRDWARRGTSEWE